MQSSPMLRSYPQISVGANCFSSTNELLAACCQLRRFCLKSIGFHRSSRDYLRRLDKSCEQAHGVLVTTESRPGLHGPGPVYSSWPRKLWTRTRSLRRRSRPVGHGSPRHVTSVTCGACTGPAGPVAPPAGAGSRDQVRRGRVGT
jgi:hypothetical protein